MSLCRGQFLLHFLEMTIAMMVGMAIFAPLTLREGAEMAAAMGVLPACVLLLCGLGATDVRALSA